jgi:hypothetical protein
LGFLATKWNDGKKGKDNPPRRDNNGQTMDVGMAITGTKQSSKFPHSDDLNGVSE